MDEGAGKCSVFGDVSCTQVASTAAGAQTQGPTSSGPCVCQRSRTRKVTTRRLPANARISGWEATLLFSHGDLALHSSWPLAYITGNPAKGFPFPTSRTLWEFAPSCLKPVAMRIKPSQPCFTMR